ncbi:hypothetical protein WMY93_001040 [Mugilogobius chulae]|uniref:Uncharacterized protein n=1 Tax=Mugilogobius chulae TaxID=88201 RepID=A0AAW0QBM4_9GOBI
MKSRCSAGCGARFTHSPPAPHLDSSPDLLKLTCVPAVCIPLLLLVCPRKTRVKMSTAAFSRSTAHPRAEAENTPPQTHSGASNTGAAQGGHVPGQDPGLAHPQLMSRPVFYVPAPTPHFMHYQWPMPFYNPFNPFSGMGYGMMMPPFPPVPYMEPPAYFLPHAPMQPVDSRRPPHPQPHPSSTAPHQTRRPRPPHPARYRETVNTEVQTEPRPSGDFRGGSPLRSCSDSGRETALNSPTSSTSSQKKADNHVENSNEANEVVDVQNTSTRSENVPSTESPLQSLKNRNVHLVRQDKVITADSPAKEMSKKERRVSVPDILLSWGNGTQQENEMANDKNEKLPSYEDDVVNFQSSTVVNEEQFEPETVDGEKDENAKNAESRLHYEPYEQSLNITLEEPSESMVMTSGKSQRKLNESIWSVESLPIYVPTKEWLAQNTTAGREVILELAEEAEKNKEDEEANEKSRSSSSGSVQLSDSFIDFSTPASKMNEMNCKQASNVAIESQNYKVQKCRIALDSPVCKERNLPEICAKEVEIKNVADPVQSPKRLSFTVEEKLEKSQDSNKDKTVILEAEKACEDESLQQQQKKVVEVVEVEQLLVPPLPLTAMELSPSKAHLVDRGVQWEETEVTNAVVNHRRNHFNTSDVHNTSTRSESAVMMGNWQKKRYYQNRNKGMRKSQLWKQNNIISSRFRN